MYITLDILQKRGACQEALDFFAKRFPDGLEMMYAIEKIHLPEHFLHWGYEHLDPSREEEAAYWKKVKVFDSTGIYQSYDVNNSFIISKSRQVNNSNTIYDSQDINESAIIINSAFVENSLQVADSRFIEQCNSILRSTNVTNSKEVFNSTYVGDSKGIFWSTNILDCTAIWHSNNLTACGFCGHCENLSRSMFCHQKQGGDLLLFNKPIDEARYNMIKRQFDKFNILLVLMEEWQLSNHVPKPFYDYRKHFVAIKEAFWQWARTLPNYDPEIMYSLTFDPQFLL